MKHQKFPVDGFEFMDEPATDDQRESIVKLCEELGTPIDPNGIWPDPFTKWDAASLIEELIKEN